jgi:hypothetical protein
MVKPVRSLALVALVSTSFLYVIPLGLAQEKTTDAATTVTGCLQKGDEAGEYSITGKDGKTYGLRSTAVDLSQHVGHKVTVKGALKPESAEKEKGEAEEHEKTRAMEAGDILVTNLKMVSDSCK